MTYKFPAFIHNRLGEGGIHIGDLRVHGGFSKAAFDENGALIHVMERLAPADAPVGPALITPAEAWAIALDRNFPDAPVPAPCVLSRAGTGASGRDA